GDPRPRARRLAPPLPSPRRTTVQSARLASSGRLEILIWERGAGFTLASGSSACAAAAAAVKLGLTAHGPIAVSMPGGTLETEVRADWNINLSGPVEEVASGTLSRDFVATLNALPRAA